MDSSDDDKAPGASGAQVEVVEAPVREDGLPRRTVDFGWVDNKPVSGRRAAKEKEKRKIKPGAFGATLSQIPISENLPCTVQPALAQMALAFQNCAA